MRDWTFIGRLYHANILSLFSCRRCGTWRHIIVVAMS